MDDQIITGILVCLPPKSVYKFRIVSKSWNDLITHPFFIQRYGSQQRRGGGVGLLYVFKSIPPTKSNVKCKIIPLDIPDSRKIECPTQEQELGKFINSSNGLILYQPYTHSGHLGELRVLNPFTKKSVSLPPPPPVNTCVSIGLMCEANNTELAAKYTVIRIDCEFDRPEKDSLRIVTYSSTTGLWAHTEPSVITTGDPSHVLTTTFQSFPAVALNGVFHWYYAYGDRLTLALYRRPRREEVVQIRSFDGIYNIKDTSTAMARSSIDDGDTLWFGCMERDCGMRVFMLQNACEDNGWSDMLSDQEWIFCYRISGCSISKLLLSSPGIVLKGLLFMNNKKTPVALIRSRAHWNAFLYDLETESLQSFPYDGQPLTFQEWNGRASKSYLDVYPYLVPSSLSFLLLS